MSDSTTTCRCNRSLGVISAIFASLAVLALIAENGCLDSGGRVGDAAWVCEAASGASANIWSFVSPFAMGLVALGVGIPLYFGVNALGGRFIAAYKIEKVAEGATITSREAAEDDHSQGSGPKQDKE